MRQHPSTAKESHVPDSQGNIHPPGSVKFDHIDGLPVHVGTDLDLKTVVGRAYLEEGPGGLVLFADIDVFDSFLNEKVADLMYPSVCGYTLEREGNVHEHVEVKSVALSFPRNADHRIDTLGNQKRKAQGKT